MNLKEAFKKDESCGTGNNKNSFDFFNLKTDKETGIVRFLYENDEDVDFAFIHEMEIDGKRRKVECPDPENGCVVCNQINKPKLKLFLQLIEDDKLKVWERGKTFIRQFISLSERYSPLWKRCFEIERNGQPGDLKTTYQVYLVDCDKEVGENILDRKIKIKDGKKGFILQLTPEEMQQAIDGCFTINKEDQNGDSGNAGEQNPRRREAVPNDSEEVF